VSTPLAPLVIEQIMREHMDRAKRYRRAAPVRADRHRSVRHRLWLAELSGWVPSLDARSSRTAE
jgi:hypothetical protein